MSETLKHKANAVGWLRGLGWAVGVSLVMAVAFELVWFAVILRAPAPPLKADLLAVYGGELPRYVGGLALERRGDFRYIVFSDAKAVWLRAFLKSAGPTKQAQWLLEPRARTTSENARFVARLAVAHGLGSILVVTSWWHLPRALFLSHVALWGTGIKVTGIAVDAAPRTGPLDSQLGWELLRFWGSLATFTDDHRRTYAPFDIR